MRFSEIEEIKTILGLQHLEYELQPEWGSKNQHHQNLIHAEIKKLGVYNPRFSISHTLSLGGFIWTNDIDTTVGLDVEIVKRVRPEIAVRVCRLPAEYFRAPSPSSLWSAKEACFKALRGPNQPYVISEIEMKDWTKTPSGIEIVSSNQGGLGCVFYSSEYVISIYKLVNVAMQLS